MLKKYLYLIIPITILLGFLGYKFLIPTATEITHINTEQLAEMITTQDENVFYVDVRETYEFSEGYIEGMNNVPLSQLDSNFHLIPKDKSVVIICRSGNRSQQAANLLQDLGYPDIINVKGGMLAWKGDVTK